MKLDLIDRRFGRLVAINPSRMWNGKRFITLWRCRCDCGTERSFRRDVLVQGFTRSCGCLQREQASITNTKHGRARTRIHRIWSNMKHRCLNPKAIEYHNYGGRGISIHPEWITSFAAFVRDVGEPPSAKHSLDRWPDFDGNYEPGNVRWATAKEQGRNRRGLIDVQHGGKRMCLAEAAESVGIAYGTVHARVMKHGWSIQDALTVPPVVGQKVQRR